MRTDEMVAAVRGAAFIPDLHPTYTNAVIINEINRTFANVFVDPVVNARAGFWLHHYDQAIAALQPRYRIYGRTAVAGLEEIEIIDPSGLVRTVVLGSPAEIGANEGSTATSQNFPQFYDLEGETIILTPKPSTGANTLRQNYYARPSRLVTQQSSTLGGGTIRGQITAINLAARTCVVNAIPFDQELAAPAAITTGVTLIDVVHPDGWHELPLVGASQTFAGTTITFTDTQALTDLQVGDFVRAAEQTDWLCIPDEFHQVAADCTAVRLLMQQAMVVKSNGLAAKIGLVADGPADGTDLARFATVLEPRVKVNPKRIVRRSGIINSSRQPPGWWWP